MLAPLWKRRTRSAVNIPTARRLVGPAYTARRAAPLTVIPSGCRAPTEDSPQNLPVGRRPLIRPRAAGRPFRARRPAP